jgi:hypothetical protein
MSPVALGPIEQNIFNAIQDQLKSQDINKEEAYDRLVSLITDSDTDLVSIEKRLDNTSTYDLPFLKKALSNMIAILLSYKSNTARIGNSFKQQFLTLWNKILNHLLSIIIDNYNSILEWIANEVTAKILQIRDIRWLLQDMEKYIIQYRLFRFVPYKIVPNSDKMSRDNYYLLKNYYDDDNDATVFIHANSKIIETLKSDKDTYFTKWLTCDLCRINDAEALRYAIENGASFNKRDQPSDQTDELCVALRCASLDCLLLLQEYETKEGRPIKFNETHAQMIPDKKRVSILQRIAPELIKTSDAQQDKTTQSILVASNEPLPLIPDDQFSIKTFKPKSTTTSYGVSYYDYVSKLTYNEHYQAVILQYDHPSDKTRQIEQVLKQMRLIFPEVFFAKTQYSYDFEHKKYNILMFKNGHFEQYKQYRESDDSFGDIFSKDLSDWIESFYDISIDLSLIQARIDSLKSLSIMTKEEINEYNLYSYISQTRRKRIGFSKQVEDFYEVIDCEVQVTKETAF